MQERKGSKRVAARKRIAAVGRVEARITPASGLPSEFVFESFEPGMAIVLGERTLTKKEMLAFACAYDPQAIHTDEKFAKASMFGGLIASGWLTISVFMRLLIEKVISRSKSLGSPGIDEIRWWKPVRAGDRLRARMVILACTPSTTNLARGTVTFRAEVENGARELVMTMIARGFFPRRDVPLAAPQEKTNEKAARTRRR